MIPVKLELTNFLAYRDPEPLDMAGLHLACLAGANGAGKSSLLDAITWSLWGKARTRRDDDLIHGDEIEMEVRLTFQLMTNTYRVTRFRSRQGRGRSELALEVHNVDQWRVLTGSTIRETQERINELLRLDYETFINSAFLVQGRADEFTQKTPGDRKAILGEILGLDRWKIYEERAKEHVKTSDNLIRRIDAQLESIDTELRKKDDYQQELEIADQELDELTAAAEGAAAHVRELESVRQHRQSLQDRFSDLQDRIQRADQDHQTQHDRLSRYEARLADSEALLADQEEIEDGYRLLVTARTQAEEMSGRLMEQSELSKQQSAYQQTIASARSALEAELRSLTNQQSTLEQRIAETAGEDEQLTAKRAEILELEQLERDVEGHRSQIAELTNHRTGLTATNRGLKDEMTALNAQQEQITATDDPVCPLCEQELSDTHRADLLARLALEGKDKGDAYRDNQDEIQVLTDQINELNAEILEAEGHLRSLKPLRDYVSRNEAKLEQADRARADLDQVTEKLTAIQLQLDEGTYAADAQASLLEINHELAELGYDDKAHQASLATVDELSLYEVQKSKLEHTLKDHPDIQDEVARLREDIANKDQQMAEDRATSSGLTAEIDELDVKINDLAEWEFELNRLNDAKGKAHYRVGAAEQKLNTLETQRARRQTLTDERQRLGEEQSIYEELRQAFSKNGIPAMIIEAAIPEIETEANQLLTRMTDGRMHVRFETQRENVTGGVRETLDIQIADELGTRDYETFSGGEAFRVDFAIRLALSRLLARRAGTQLRTLILDEGFGTQDAMGRERLVQAINSIKEDFDLILVITHIDELKDAFPARIEVTKTNHGSIIEIV